jgi:acyl-CoA synthetase (AMP-forming)/AMP-acid ligase II
MQSTSTFEFKGNSGSCTLWYDSGELCAKTPESWELEPMLALARILKARVRGDEFETYDSLEKTYFHPDDRSLRHEAEARSKAIISKSTLDQRLIRNGIVGFFFVPALVGDLVGSGSRNGEVSEPHHMDSPRNRLNHPSASSSVANIPIGGSACSKRFP